MSHINPQKMGNATSIFNLMRNIGGSIGIAIMTTFLSRRTQLHQDHLVANVTAGSPQTLRLLEGMRANFYAHGADSVTASRKAVAAIYGLVQQHAAMLAFVEAFWLMGVVFLLMIPFLPILQYSKKRPAPKPAAKPELTQMSEVQPPSFALQETDEEADEEVPEEEPHLLIH